MITGFEGPKVWALAHQLALRIFLLSKQFPRDERSALRPSCVGQLLPFLRTSPREVPDGIPESFCNSAA